VKLVTIDTSKGKDVANAKQDAIKESVPETKVTPEKSDLLSNNVAPTVPKPASIDVELGVAKELMSKMTGIVTEMNESFKNGETVGASQVSPFIEETLASLQRNNQALTTLINMQRKDQSLAEHAFATFSLILSLSLKLNLKNEEKEMLGLAAFFHDVGWLKLPLNLLGKKSAYTSSEVKLIHQHISIGHKTLLKQCDLPDLVLRIISEHHEFIDGSGYPQKLSAEKLHPLSKFFSVVVRYDELIHGLLDRPALTPNGALAALFKESQQGKLDPLAVSHLISLLSVYPAGSCVLLSNKEKARVIEAHPDHPKQPKVKVYYDISGIAHSKARVLDLARQSGHEPLEIVSILDISDPKVDPAHVLGSI
jgi:HD-GYP domain-containing protein (c-di-GMP phosphodiesterase class II)